MAALDSHFSNFINGGDLVVGDIVVGLRDGLNTKFLNTGGIGTGTVTEVDTGTGLTGGPITFAGIISFSAINAHSLWANVTGSSAVPTMIPTSTFLMSANNLSDLPDKPTARTNLGVAIGTNVEAWSAALDSIAGLTTSANQIIYTTGSNTYAAGQTLPTAVQGNITQLGIQSQAFNMGSHLINNVTNPVSAQDAATKSYVDTAGGAFLPLTGGTMSGIINMGNNKITNVTDPSSPQDASTKAYSDLMLPLTGGTMSGVINMNTHKITNLTDPTNPQDAATLAYVTAQTSGTYLPLIGGTMAGVINMGNHKITNLTDPSSGQDAVTLTYLNTALIDYLALSGGTMTGTINMGSHKITNVTDPTNPQDAATKNYVDLVATGLTVQPACYAATTANLNAIYVNGASGIGATLTNNGALIAFATDGTSPPTNARILVWEQSSTLQNGIYTLTNQGSGAVAWILTRSTDYDQPAEINPGDLVIINNGTVYAGTSFIETASVAAIGTDPILFSQFTFSASSVLLKANNLSDVANATTSFNNISPLTTKGDLIGFSTQNIRVAVGGTDAQILQVNSAATAGFSWSTATYPVTTTVNQILFSSATNTITGISSLAGGVLVTDNSSVPQMLTNPGAAGKMLQSANAAIPTWSTPTYPSASGTLGKFLISDGTNNVYSTSTIPTSAGATANKLLLSDGTNYVLSTPTFPNASATSGKLIISDGTNWIASTSIWPNTVGTSGKFIISDGTSNGYSTSTIPTSAGATANKLLLSDGTNYVLSTPTFPNASATIRKIIVSDGTNWVASTETYAVPGTTGNVLTSDGTNWTSAAPAITNVLTTKGDLLSFTTVDARLAVGSTNGQILQVNSAAATGLSYSTPTYPSASGTAGKVLISDGTNNVYSTPTYPSTAGTSGNALISDGTNWNSSSKPAINSNSFTSGRLTLTSGTPVTNTDVTAATTLYYTPYIGNLISLYNGSTWDVITFTEISIAIPATTSKMYDVFCYNNSGTATLELLVWTNDTTRATALTYQDGVYSKTGALTRRYLGSIRTTGVSGQTEDSALNRLVWNYYNRRARQLSVVDATSSWTYSTATFRQARGSTANQVSCVTGVSEDILNLSSLNSVQGNGGTSGGVAGGIGLNSTTTPILYGFSQSAINENTLMTSTINQYMAIGYNFLAWLERGNAVTGTLTWAGTAGGQNCGLYGFLWG